MDEPTIPVKPLTEKQPAGKAELAPAPPPPIAKSEPPPPRSEPTITFKPETAAEAWLGLLAARGVKYLFANGGTDFAPVVE
ncbi:MAG: hypothetical protein ACJ8G5_05635, partial [Burkholderiales bacterium]